jgi:hypothetical protein
VSFQLFCQKATDNQLKNILQKEFEAGRHDDYQTAREAALSRGWTYEQINTYRTHGGS